MSEEFVCLICHREFKKAGHLRMHEERAHGVVEDQDAPVPVAPEPVVEKPSGPAHLHLRRATRLTRGARSIKMVRPRCRTCQREPNRPRDWYLRCPHNPYMGLKEVKEVIPRYSEPDEQGRRKVLGVDEMVHWETEPNLASVPVTVRVNSGDALEKQRRKGWILPEELRCPEYPNGLLPFCEFRECGSQDIAYRTPYGNYCQEMEVKLVIADYHGVVLEIGFDQKSSEKRQRQMVDLRL